MVNAKLLIICFLILSLIEVEGYSQDCNIEVVAETINTAFGQATGSVHFKMKDQSELKDQFLIFDLTAARNGVMDRIKVEGKLIGNLAAGKYEFLVVDRKREKCAKEIFVEIKEQ